MRELPISYLTFFNFVKIRLRELICFCAVW